MDSVELFDETYYGARSESEVDAILKGLGYRSGDFSREFDYPKKYPCVFRIKWNNNPNGKDWGDLYVYYEENLREFTKSLSDILGE